MQLIMNIQTDDPVSIRVVCHVDEHSPSYAHHDGLVCEPRTPELEEIRTGANLLPITGRLCACESRPPDSMRPAAILRSLLQTDAAHPGMSTKSVCAASGR